MPPPLQTIKLFIPSFHFSESCGAGSPNDLSVSLMLFWVAKPIGPKAPLANASICVLAPPTRGWCFISRGENAGFVEPQGLLGICSPKPIVGLEYLVVAFSITPPSEKTPRIVKLTSCERAFIGSFEFGG
jgi:hypothetical protein